MLKRICIFCGSSDGAQPAFIKAGKETGQFLAQQGIEVVTGGGGIGLMGAVADGTLAAGGKVIGVIPKLLVLPEVAHTGLTRIETVGTMHDRKARMEDLSDGFIVLPGGLGTMEELFEIWSWCALGIHQKPIGILNVGGFYDSLIAMIDNMVTQGFIRQIYQDTILISDNLATLLEAFRAYKPPKPLTQLIKESG